VFETAITLDELYGFPVFRGSAAKGMTRHWAEVWDVGARGPDGVFPNKKAVEDVFGKAPEDSAPGHMGKVEFLGGVPEPPINVELDIMTPHYRDWYEKGPDCPPSDWSNPIQVYFLTVPAGVRFVFHLSGPETEVATAARWHCDALEQIGIGAKTAAGYGYFHDFHCRPCRGGTWEGGPECAKAAQPEPAERG